MKFTYNRNRYETYISDPVIAVQCRNWCELTYGRLGDQWEGWGQWFMFKNESDTMLFQLKWGSA